MKLGLTNVVWFAVISLTCATYEQLFTGYTNVYDESVDADVIIERGQVPEWLEGIFLRHSCGAFGSTGSQDEDIDRITHEFDCIPMGTSFKFQDGRVSFYNRCVHRGTYQLEPWPVAELHNIQ